MANDIIKINTNFPQDYKIGCFDWIGDKRCEIVDKYINVTSLNHTHTIEFKVITQ